MNVARLLLPALRWKEGEGFEGSRDAVERGLAAGVGGFILFGGTAEGVRALAAELHRRAPHPLLVGSDLERGAGQQFRGATPLPPAAALAALDDPEVTARAGALTAREARALGVNWIFAPVADVDLEPANPIVSSRAFGTDPAATARQVEAWVRGCARGGALSCAKHFPGHGRTVGDSHAERPIVHASREALEADLLPFRAAIAAGTDAVMTAHVVYPALDPAGRPATLSPPVLGPLLREELGFRGVVVTDALVMEGLTEGGSEADASVRAMAAGCDLLLYPDDPDDVARGLSRALKEGTLPAARVEDALARVATAAARVAGGPEGDFGTEEDRRWALGTAVRTLRVLRGAPRLSAGPVRLEVVEDDLGGPWPPYSRETFPASLREAGVELAEHGAPLVAVYSDVRAWKGRAGLAAAARERLAALLVRHPDAPVVLFAHPRLEAEVGAARHLLAAWGGEALMQQAAAAWLTGRSAGAARVEAAGVER